MADTTIQYQDVVLDTLKSKTVLGTDATGLIIDGTTGAEGLFLKLDQTTPQVTVGTFTFPDVVVEDTLEVEGENEISPAPTGTISISQVTDSTNLLGYAYQSYKYEYPYTSPTYTSYYYNAHTFNAYTYITRDGIKYYSQDAIQATFDDAQLDQYYLVITLPALPAGADGWAVFEAIDQGSTSGRTPAMVMTANATNCAVYYPAGLTFNDGASISATYPTPWTIGVISDSFKIGTSYPMPQTYAPPSVNTKGGVKITDGSFYIEGEIGEFPSALGLPGNHFAYLPQYGALRIGQTTSTQFQKTNIGFSSIGLGKDNVASGYASICFGAQSEATATASMAFGLVAKATETYAIAMGYSAEASELSSIAIGPDSSASGNYAVALGWVARASKTGAVSIGVNNLASGTYAVATGYRTVSSGNGSFSAGWNANSDDTSFIAGSGTVKGAIALGYASTGNTHKALTEGSVVIGQDLNATSSANIICIGRGFSATQVDTFNVGFGAINYKFTSTGLTLSSGVDISFSGGDIITDTTTGTKIGTATNQKLGFFNATPIVQVGATIDLGVALSNLGLRAAGTAYPITTSGAVTFTNAYVGLKSDSTLLKFGAGDDMSISYNGTVGRIDASLVAASDLQIDCGTDKTLVLDEGVYNDANVGGLVLRTGGTAPGVVQWLDNDGDATGLYTIGFEDGEQGSGSIEIPHNYKQGTDLVFHIHYGLNDAPTGTDKIRFDLIYNVQRDGTTFVDATTIDSTDVTVDTQYKTGRIDFTAITGTNFLIGDQFNFTIKRTTAVGDAYSGEVLIETVGFHYEADTLGSRQIGTK